jgi:hypothetical protein
VGLRFIVRQGALRRFHRLKQATSALPVDVIWDRRSSQPESRETRRALNERRQQSSITWAVADFVLVESEDPQTDDD